MKFFLSVILFFAFTHVFSYSVPMDSVGLEKKGGKTYILHKVEEKETLYSLSRRYNVPINAIADSNEGSDFGLSIGQIIRVPLASKKTQPENSEIVRQQDGDKSEKIHTVRPKETMFSISREYSISIDDIKKWNGLDSNSLDIGQQLIIKQTNTASADEPQILDRPLRKGKTHTVKPGETLYSISRANEISIDELKNWNSIQNNEISIGQTLYVSKPGPLLLDKDRALELNEPASKEAVGAEIGDKPKEADLPKEDDQPKVKNDNTDVPVEVKVEKSSTKYAEVSESGLAELIEGSENTRKYLALHRTAETGTIMKVRNEMNGQEVFVRVMGKLPDTGLNKNLLIKVSKSAYDRLGAIDAKFRVSVSYIP